eukprot:scaffold76812_cov40-Prasinocladus_malaysianus.AAC.1
MPTNASRCRSGVYDTFMFKIQSFLMNVTSYLENSHTIHPAGTPSSERSTATKCCRARNSGVSRCY